MSRSFPDGSRSRRAAGRLVDRSVRCLGGQSHPRSRLGTHSEVFATSDLRLLRVGQRLSLELGPSGRAVSPDTSDPQGGAVVTRLWIVGIGDDEAIVSADPH